MVKKYILIFVALVLATFAVLYSVFLLGDNSRMPTVSSSDETIVIADYLTGSIHIVGQEGGRWELKHEVSEDTFAGLFPELHAEEEGWFPEYNLLDDNTLVLGGSTAVHVFELDGGKFIPRQEISHETFPGLFKEHEFIWPLALEGDVLLGGDGLINESLYVFRRPDDKWELGETISSGGTFGVDVQSNALDFFSSIELDGNTFVATAKDGIYIFRADEGRWEMEQAISRETFPELSAEWEGGYNFSVLSLHSDRLAIGTPIFSADHKVLVFKRESNQWVFEQEFSSETFPEAGIETGDFKFFGTLLALSEDMLVAGDYSHLYVFGLENGRWVFKQEISEAAFGRLENRLGYDFHLGDGILAVSHMGATAGSTERGQLTSGRKAQQLLYIFAQANGRWTLEQVLEL